MSAACAAHSTRLPAAAVLWTVLLAGCDRAPNRTDTESRALSHERPSERRAEPHPRPEGPVYDDDDFRLEAGLPRVCNKTAPFLPEPGLLRLSIPVVVRAKTRRLIPISPLSFQLTDSEGRRYGPTLAGCQPALKNVRLEEGQSVEGDVAFDVAVGARDLELGFDPFLIGRKEVHALVLVPSRPSGETTEAEERRAATSPDETK